MQKFYGQNVSVLWDFWVLVGFQREVDKWYIKISNYEIKFQTLQTIFTNSGTLIKFKLRCVTIGEVRDEGNGPDQLRKYNDKKFGLSTFIKSAF